jgi:predicted RNA-binding protein associated with RNAse of E/G family
MSTVRIHYHRPGKELAIYQEDLLSVDETRLCTQKTLPADISAQLELALQNQGLIHPGQRIHSIRKVYHFHENFNLLEFRGPGDELIGHYSDIGLPLEKFGEDYAMLDLFLDIWRHPNGTLIELDWDEFEDAQTRNLITPEQAQIARQAMQRLIAEAAQGVYPDHYLE